MRLLDLVNLAGPLLVILVAQRDDRRTSRGGGRLPGRSARYNAGDHRRRQVGFGMSSTTCALAVVEVGDEARGPSPLAFIIVPMVGAFFIDVAIRSSSGFLTLPLRLLSHAAGQDEADHREPSAGTGLRLAVLVAVAR